MVKSRDRTEEILHAEHDRLLWIKENGGRFAAEDVMETITERREQVDKIRSYTNLTQTNRKTPSGHKLWQHDINFGIWIISRSLYDIKQEKIKGKLMERARRRATSRHTRKQVQDKPQLPNDAKPLEEEEEMEEDNFRAVNVPEVEDQKKLEAELRNRAKSNSSGTEDHPSKVPKTSIEVKDSFALQLIPETRRALICLAAELQLFFGDMRHKAQWHPQRIAW
ncbi:hypothetical protein FSARC_4680 [Fusarium sarcochroum]|uniref:Uncharacterized protein n=1 Tax=Fusarium sarcochroum TaxID=1208366 RepID=A0A8H4U118_9HYPO|nr:hypothetical protein FSARC_4680 [Fusarium sarcochroum]